ncbi:MAG: HEPN domain-containing protein [Methylococcales bacterium]|nr:HEPN domain-containing protein [Methylococcales bacterium]
MRTKPPDQERALITRRDPKRPYGAKITFQLLHSASIGELENVTFLLESGTIATIQPARSASWEGCKRFQVTLEGFSTATAAEYEGLRFAQALLLSAISLNFGLRLNYHAQEPAVVFERFRSEGATMWGEGVAGWSQPIALAELVGACTHPVLDRTLILSMELYCAAFLEPNERARFVTVVSALEPLAKQESLGTEVSEFVDGVVFALEKAEGIQDGIRSSLNGRLKQLRVESVRQALFRLSNTWFPQRVDVRHRIDRAYALRSELLHEGTLLDPDIDIATETAQIANILRAIYEQASGRSFRVPTEV